jgi:hypothetical protein
MMEEPERMRDQNASAFERALLEEGRSYRGAPDLRAHTLAALGVASSAGMLAALGAWLAEKTWATKLLLAMSALTLAVGIPLGYVMLRHAPPPPAPVAPAVAPALLPAPVAAAPAPLPAPVPAAPALAAAPPSRPTTMSAGSSSALRAELAALDAVRSTLANDDAPGALSFLTAYFRTFPHGRLHLEAEVLRIDALAKAGQVDAARRFAKDFLRRHPNSVLTARVLPYAER